MNIVSIDDALRGAAFALAVQTFILFRRAPHGLATRLGSIFLAATAAQALGDDVIAGLPVPLNFMVAALASLAIPLFWMFTRAWFDDAFRPGAREAAMAVVFMLMGMAESAAAPTSATSNWLIIAIDIAGTVLAGHALWLAWTGRDQDLVEHRRRLRSLFIVAVAVLILWSLWSGLIASREPLSPPHALLTDVPLAAIALLLTTALFGLRHPDMFAPAGSSNIPAALEPSSPIGEELPSAARIKLEMLMRKDRLYREPGLTIGKLATRVGVPEHRLRRFVNGTLGYRNFSEYLNGLRLAEVRTALADPVQREVPILTIALDAGFGSLPAFNRAFKATGGETPSEYRRRLIADT